MKELKGHTETKYWIATSTDVVHYGIAEVGQTVTTGQDELIVYDNEEDWKNKLNNTYNIEIEDGTTN